MLYDKICREDILLHAYERARDLRYPLISSNDGKHGCSDFVFHEQGLEALDERT